MKIGKEGHWDNGVGRGRAREDEVGGWGGGRKIWVQRRESRKNNGVRRKWRKKGMGWWGEELKGDGVGAMAGEGKT